MNPYTVSRSAWRDRAGEIWRHRVLVLVVAIVASATATSFAYFSKSTKPIYVSTVLVNVTPLPSTLFQGPQNMQIEKRLAESAPVAALAAKNMNAGHVRITPDYLRGIVKVEVIPASSVLQITVRVGSPSLAVPAGAQLALAYIHFRNAFAGRILRARSQQVTNLLATQTDALAKAQQTLAATPKRALRLSALERARISSLNHSIAQLQAKLARYSSTTITGGYPFLGDLGGNVQRLSLKRHVSAAVAGFAFLVGLLLGSIGAIGRERLRRSVESWSDVARVIRSARTVVGVPEVAMDGSGEDVVDRLMEADTSSPAAAAFRTLRHEVVQRGPRPLMIAVVSPDPLEGRTFVAANLAIAAAGIGRRVILVSADLRNPRAHIGLGVPDRPGLEEVLSGARTPREALHATAKKGLFVLPSAASDSSGGKIVDLMASEGMVDVARELRSEADVVIFDTPAFGSYSDARSVSSLTDGVLVVAEANATSRRRLAELADALGDLTVAAVVLNREGRPARWRRLSPLATPGLDEDADEDDGDLEPQAAIIGTGRPGRTEAPQDVQSAQAPSAQAPPAQAPSAQAPPAQAPPAQAPSPQAPSAQAPSPQAPSALEPSAEATRPSPAERREARRIQKLEAKELKARARQDKAQVKLEAKDAKARAKLEARDEKARTKLEAKVLKAQAKDQRAQAKLDAKDAKAAPPKLAAMDEETRRGHEEQQVEQ
jgi:Mrp family chromosome partitioning ATPase/capsular polysaccharide biosynthesis protein